MTDAFKETTGNLNTGPDVQASLTAAEQAAAEALAVKVCSIAECSNPSRARGWCNMHYLRWKKHRNPESQPPPSSTFKPVKKRFYENVSLPNEDGCMLWMSYRDRKGYGRIRVDGKLVGAHRIAYELMVRPIPEGLQIDHVRARGCRSTACCNPDHLEPVTGRVNTMRSSSVSAKNAAKTHCINGHPFDEENTYRSPKGNRFCRTCARDRNRKASARAAERQAEGATDA